MPSRSLTPDAHHNQDLGAPARVQHHAQGAVNGIQSTHAHSAPALVDEVSSENATSSVALRNCIIGRPSRFHLSGTFGGKAYLYT
jgi:hypothetical protein